MVDIGNIFFKKVFIFTTYSVIITTRDYGRVAGLEKSLTNVNFSEFYYTTYRATIFKTSLRGNT